MIFIDIPTYCVQHKFLIHFICITVVKPPEFLILFDIPEMSLSLYGTGLPFYDPFFTLDICMGFFFQLFPLFVDLHHLIFLSISFFFIFIQAFGLMLAAAAVRTSIHFKSLGKSRWLALGKSSARAVTTLATALAIIQGIPDR